MGDLHIFLQNSKRCCFTPFLLYLKQSIHKPNTLLKYVCWCLKKLHVLNEKCLCEYQSAELSSHYPNRRVRINTASALPSVRFWNDRTRSSVFCSEDHWGPLVTAPLYVFGGLLPLTRSLQKDHFFNFHTHPCSRIESPDLQTLKLQKLRCYVIVLDIWQNGASCNVES